MIKRKATVLIISVMLTTLIFTACAPKKTDIESVTATPSATPNETELAPSGDIVDLDGHSETPSPSGAGNGDIPATTPAATAKNTAQTGSSDIQTTDIPMPTVSNANMAKYTYDALSKDIAALSAKYSIESEVIGKTKYSRDIFCIKLGNESAKNKILLIAGACGSEYGNSLLMMKQIETYLTDTSRKYAGMTYDEILGKCRIYFVPMLNLDGIEININGTSNFDASLQSLVDSSVKAGYISDTSGWEANSDGIDVSINFGRGTVTSDIIRNIPCSSGYCGAPFASAEAAAIRELCATEGFKTVAVYDGNGELIDWSFGQIKSNSISRQLAEKLASLTGYTVLSNGPDKDMCISVNAPQWFISEYDLPAFTVMTGISANGSISPADAWNKLALVPILLASESDFSISSDTEIVDIDD